MCLKPGLPASRAEDCVMSRRLDIATVDGEEVVLGAESVLAIGAAEAIDAKDFAQIYSVRVGIAHRHAGWRSGGRRRYLRGATVGDAAAARPASRRRENEALVGIEAAVMEPAHGSILIALIRTCSVITRRSFGANLAEFVTWAD